MRIAFYAPMKPPDHPVPSGDRRLARLLLRALRAGGHDVTLAARFCSRDGRGDAERQARLRTLGGRLAERLIRRYRAMAPARRPEAWLTYHVYHKAPDWLGPPIAEALGIPYAIVEASSAPKQAGGRWDIGYRGANAAIGRADAILTVNSDDWDCLQPVVRPPVLHRRMAPFVDCAPFAAAARRRANIRDTLALRHGWPAETKLLLAVGMMREGAKRDSFRVLAGALAMLGDLDWRLLVAGDGPLRDEIAAGIEAAAPGRAVFLGGQDEDAMPDLYAGADILVWPAMREAFGMSLLEAQAAGLPVVAGRGRGVPDIVASGVTGLLPPSGDAAAFARDVRRLLEDEALRRTLAGAAARRIAEKFDVPQAAALLSGTLATVAMVKRRGPGPTLQ